ncbi:bifunctional DNA-formamidopyrimidine glycosylase/DNA-(apurinic or apyrimidinic site) lyase [Chelatococcus composti]|mgnify:CR=1 FL=1|uniref:Formamidopyrimidine-DNA glycosylase n=1 Tax=Chelatococcus composti TaxID=1743235 RepID=A0A841K3I2_9HYPH|nr:bifunctional DNA-formamidopyrimidine glycosylase/DNA-(apurinic or apyrimidinic site) lyase [Chelatococcus composti]MBB6167328.1 formamidopyrimidine-DNA glycosylase [Chelatococcus composti]MBS7735535.1 bifunctional DNA-formamidopyrimidine glycosylase/DNA-(apurinic or apyrimidinic site) lyase [Chelatococcus composti]
MPELPEVETVRRGLEPAMVGAGIAAVDQRRPDLRFPFPERFAERLRGRTVISLGRRAKYLMADLSGGDILVMHLGMTGRFIVEEPGGALREPGDFYQEAGRNAAHDHVVFLLSNGVRITYNDARRFGFMTLVARDELDRHPLFRHLGVEPLGNALDGALIARLFAGRKAPLKAALMDQRLIAGLGNIYVCEALHRAGLSPLRPAGTLATKTGRATAAAERLATAIRDVLNEAVAAGGSTLRDYVKTDGSLGYFQHAFRVYDREHAPCPTPGCRGTVARLVQSGRSTFWCSQCQR